MKSHAPCAPGTKTSGLGVSLQQGGPAGVDFKSRVGHLSQRCWKNKSYFYSLHHAVGGLVASWIPVRNFSRFKLYFITNVVKMHNACKEARKESSEPQRSAAEAHGARRPPPW